MKNLSLNYTCNNMKNSKEFAESAQIIIYTVTLVNLKDG